MLHACLDMKAIILGKYHYVLYFLVLAMQVGISIFSQLSRKFMVVFLLLILLCPKIVIAENVDDGG